VKAIGANQSTAPSVSPISFPDSAANCIGIASCSTSICISAALNSCSGSALDALSASAGAAKFLRHFQKVRAKKKVVDLFFYNEWRTKCIMCECLVDHRVVDKYNQYFIHFFRISKLNIEKNKSSKAL
jgi:hypothetical protein